MHGNFVGPNPLCKYKGRKKIINVKDERKKILRSKSRKKCFVSLFSCLFYKNEESVETLTHSLCCCFCTDIQLLKMKTECKFCHRLPFYILMTQKPEIFRYTADMCTKKDFPFPLPRVIYNKSGFPENNPVRKFFSDSGL